MLAGCSRLVQNNISPFNSSKLADHTPAQTTDLLVLIPLYLPIYNHLTSAFSDEERARSHATRSTAYTKDYVFNITDQPMRVAQDSHNRILVCAHDKVAAAKAAAEATADRAEATHHIVKLAVKAGATLTPAIDLVIKAAADRAEAYVAAAKANIAHAEAKAACDKAVNAIGNAKLTSASATFVVRDVLSRIPPDQPTLAVGLLEVAFDTHLNASSNFSILFEQAAKNFLLP